MKELFEKAGWSNKPIKAVVVEKKTTAQDKDLNHQSPVLSAPLIKPNFSLTNLLPAEEGTKPMRAKKQREPRQLPLEKIRLDDSLPVVQRSEDIIAAISNHQVLILAGETGSGKTTQLPKLAMLAGRGQLGRIALTQPRRLAARSVAVRLAEELDCKIGELVGVKVRFHQQVANETAIKVLTDGMLLAEIQQDKLLREYDTIIVDEAHERSLNIDFLLGYLRQLKDKRPELKIIVTSATIDLERFAEFFGGAPIISVSGRTYPVQVRYQPLSELAVDDSEEVDLNLGIVRAVEQLTAHDPHGDILVFLPGEGDIRDAAEILRLEGLKHTEVLPLFARQSFAEQQRIFSTGGARRIVLATNVAETSLTVPGIRHVIDSGLARIKRYSPRNKVQRLPIEAISQASANQRKGRCGRVAPGVCIRLYGEDDFMARSAFTEPEMQRSNLASVILQMQMLGFGSIESFPLIDPPSGKLVNDGYRLLEALQAVDRLGELTPLGKTLSRLPTDPRVGRMLVAAESEGVLAEVCVLAGVLSLQDPRETPADKQQAAREKHKTFDDPRSDFLTLLNLWEAYEYQRKHTSHSKLKTWCQKHYLSGRRMREWHELVGQMHQSVTEFGWKLNDLNERETLEDGSARVSETTAICLHKSLLTGLLGQIALRDERTRSYQGARGVQLAIHPSSVLSKSRAKWIMAFEWVETSKTWARFVSEIDVSWLESLAGHLITRNYSEPYWSKKQGRVLAKETVSLYGLPIVGDRPADFGKVDPKVARELFIRDGLVTGEVMTRWAFLQQNQKLMDEALDWEDKTRRSDVLVDDMALADFYLQRLPEGMCRTVSLDKWLKAKPERMALLTMTKADVFRKEVDGQQDFPNQLQLPNRLRLPLQYKFSPGDSDDGMTINVTLAQLPLLREDNLAKLVPGLLPQKIEAIIRALPKPLRVKLQPATQQAQQAAKVLSAQSNQSFEQALSQVLSKQAGAIVSPDDWASVAMPEHLSPRICIMDGKKVLAQGRDLTVLQAQFAEEARLALREHSALTAQTANATTDVAKTWHWDEIARIQKIAGGGQAFLALVLDEDGVVLSPLPSQQEADTAHAAGVRRLLGLALAQTLNGVRKELLKGQGLCLPWARWQRPCADLVEQLVERALIALTPEAAQVRTRDAFDAQLNAIRAKVTGQIRDYAQQTQQLLQLGQQLLADCTRLKTPTRSESIADIEAFIQQRLNPSFVIDMTDSGWRDVPRYLKAAAYRLEKLTENLPLDERRQDEYRSVERLMLQAKGLQQMHPERYLQAQTMAIELWVATFAQPLALKGSASLKRFENILGHL